MMNWLTKDEQEVLYEALDAMSETCSEHSETRQLIESIWNKVVVNP